MLYSITARGVGHHLACEDDMLFDLRYDGCNFAAQTDCGERPICGPCDTECFTQSPPPPPTTAPVDCGNHTVSHCAEEGAGTHPDPFNCRKYWNCDGAGNGYHNFCLPGTLPDPFNCRKY